MAISRPDVGPELELGEYYPAKITKVEDLEPFAPGGDPRVRLTFAVFESDGRTPLRDKYGDPVITEDAVSVPMKAGDRAKIYRMWSGLFFGGKAVPDDVEMDTDELHGLPCRILWDTIPAFKDRAAHPGISKVVAASKNTSIKALVAVLDEEIAGV